MMNFMSRNYSQIGNKTRRLPYKTTVEPLYNDHLGRCKEVPLYRGFKQESMYGFFQFAGTKKRGRLDREGSTVS